MGRRKRQRIEPTDDWQQLHLLTTSAEQHLYELIRPIVLFGHSPAERARQTGAAERTLYRQSARFEADGMTSLFASTELSQRRTLPPEIRQAIREQLTVAFADEALAQYQVTYQPDNRHLTDVTTADVFETPYRSPQPPLWEWGADEWLTVVRVAPYAPRQPRQVAAAQQVPLFSDEDQSTATG